MLDVTHDGPSPFISKPTRIEAWRLTEDNVEAVAAWCGGLIPNPPDLALRLAIPTPEGLMRATIGDWIIHGTHGEFYPCKPDVFAVKYDPA